jgi:hypothetical protein
VYKRQVQEELNPKRKRVQEGQDQVFFLLDAEQRAAAAESAVHRAVVDYNLALMNFSFNSGEIMSRYNVMLTEGPWSANAQNRAAEKASRYIAGGPPRHYDVHPVSAGPYDQQAPYAATTNVQKSESSEPGNDERWEQLPTDSNGRPELPPIVKPPLTELLLPELSKLRSGGIYQTAAR